MWRPVRCTDRRGLPPARLLSAVRTRRRRRSNRDSLAMLLLLPFLAEDVLAAIANALALVRLGLAPAADFGGELADGLLVDAADLERLGEARSHAFDEVRHQRALHAPVAARCLAVVGRRDRDRTVLELVAPEIRQAHRQRA